MSKAKTIKGTVVRNDLEGGFWGVVDEEGNEWLPINLPEQLKTAGKKVRLRIIETRDASVFNWGKPIKILSFET